MDKYIEKYQVGCKKKTETKRKEQGTEGDGEKKKLERACALLCNNDSGPVKGVRDRTNGLKPRLRKTDML